MTSGRLIQRLIFHTNKYFEKNKKMAANSKMGLNLKSDPSSVFLLPLKKVTDSFFAEPDPEMDPKLGSQLGGKL